MSCCSECHEQATCEQIMEMTGDLGGKVGANPHSSHYAEVECHLRYKMHEGSEDCCARCHAWGRIFRRQPCGIGVAHASRAEGGPGETGLSLLCG